MKNPLYKTETTQTGFNFADTVSFSCMIKGMVLENHKFNAKIMGKIKGAKAYVLTVWGLNKFYPAEAYDKRYDFIKGITSKYGYPIRQIELEWGKFSGLPGEFIIPEHELTKEEQ